MFTKSESVCIENVCDGAVAAKVDQLLEEAIKNCLALDYDLSTRKVTMTLRMTPNDRRDEIVFVPEFKIDKGKLRMPAVSMSVGINQQGKGEAREFMDRQQALFNQGVVAITAGNGEKGGV
jgi:hypothetical protein